MNKGIFIQYCLLNNEFIHVIYRGYKLMYYPVSMV